MALLELVQAAIAQKMLTPDLEAQINDWIWTHSLNRQELKALADLLRGLETGAIATTPDPQLYPGHHSPFQIAC